MPAQSESQARTARAALAYKHGHLKLASLAPGFRKAVKSMASMSEEQLEDFKHTTRKSKSLVKQED